MHYETIISRGFRLKGEILWILLGQAGVMIGGITGIKLLTQAVAPVEFGRFALASTIILLIGTNVFGPIGQGFMRFWSITKERGERAGFGQLSGKILLKLSFCILMAGSGVAAGLFLFKDWRWGLLVFLSITGGILSGWAGVRLSILMAARERKYVALINTAAAFAKPIAGVLLVYLFVADTLLILLGYIISLWAMVMVCENHFKKLLERDAAECPKVKTSDGGLLKKELFAFTYPFYVWGLFGWMHQSCDRWAIQFFHGTDVVGSFFVISQLAVYPLVAWSSFLNTFFIPIAYQKAGSLMSGTDFRSAIRMISIMTGLYIMGAVTLIVIYWYFHELIVMLISNEQFVVYSKYLPGLTGAWALYYLGQMFAGFGLLANRPDLYMAPIISSGLLVTVLSFVLSSRYGVPGVVSAIAVAGFVYALWSLVISSFLIHKRGTTIDV